MRSIYFAALAGSLFASSLAFGTAFQNGSFESPGGAPIRQSLSNGDTFVTGWINNGGFQIYESAPNDGVNAAADGTYWVSFGHNGNTGGTLTQTFDTTAGTSYLVNFMTIVQQGTSFQGVTATAFDGATTLSTVSSSFSNTTWAAGPTLTFTAASNSTTLQFLDSSADSGGANWGLDAVTVAEVGGSATPEPATGLLLAGAVAAFAAVRRMRRA